MQIASTIAGASGPTSVTTSGIDTTGANLIVISASAYSGDPTPVITDSKSNTWTALTVRSNTNARARIFYCVAPVVGTGHTFTTGGTGGYPVIAVRAFSGAHASPYESESGTTGTGTSGQPGSLTPSTNGSLIVTVIGTAANLITGIDSGFAESHSDYSGGAHMGGGNGYLIQTSAAAVNPAWSMNASTEFAVAAAVFKAA